MIRIDLCTACHRPFQVEVVGADRSQPKETVWLVCPNCRVEFTEQARGVLLTSAMSPEEEAACRERKSAVDLSGRARRLQPPVAIARA
jgi:hypothetical protein